MFNVCLMFKLKAVNIFERKKCISSQCAWPQGRIGRTVEKKISEADYFLNLFHLRFSFLEFFGECMNNFILNKLSQQKFPSKHVM